MEDGEHLWSHIPHMDSGSTEAIAICEIMLETLFRVVMRKGITYVDIQLAFPRKISVKMLGLFKLSFRLFVPRLISLILFKELAKHGGN